MKITKENLKELYITQNLSAKETAKILKCGRTTIYNYLRKFKLPVKKSGRQQKYFANEFFFDKWSHDMAYCIGFIAADGHVWKDRPYITISIHKKDVKVLEYIISKISPDTKIRKNKDQVQICIHSKGLHSALLKYNINNDKTFGFKIDYKIPNKFFGDFLRGYFDGDGCIYPTRTRKDGSHIYSGSIVSASRQPLEYFAKILGFSSVRVVRNKYYTIEFSQKNLLKLKQIMYKGNRFCLERKRCVFDKIKIIRTPWTKKEDNIVINNPNLSRKEIHKLLPHRTLSAVSTRIKVLKSNAVK